MKFIIILVLNLRIIQTSFTNSTNSFNNIKLNNSKSYKEFFKISQNFIIDLNHENVSSECKESHEIFKNSLQNLEFWALQMFDANAKLSSGLLNGNIYQFGDFDQCLSATAPESQFQGQYCLSSIMFDIPESYEYFNNLKYRMLSLNPFISEFSDVSHIVPKSSEFKWAFCIPSNCDAVDLEVALKKSLSNFLKEFPIKAHVQTNQIDCQVRINDKTLTIGEKLSIGFFAALIPVIAVSTFAECFFASADPFTTAFSIKKNINELLSTESSTNDIKCMNSIRTFLTILLMIAHKAMEQAFNPIEHKMQMIEFLLQPINLIFRISYLHTDVFLMFSGFLVTQSFMARTRRGQIISIVKEIFNRYLRLIPSIAILILFVTFVLPNLGSGPLWPMLIDYQADICKKTWLSSIFMMQNFIGIENICMMHTHHVATDFQLFLVAPVIAMGLCNYPEKTVKIVGLMALVSTIGRFLVVYFGEISVFMTAGIKIPDIFRTADLMYILPPYRFTVYSMGILLAYYISNHKNQRITQKSISTGWIWAIIAMIITIAISSANDEQTPIKAALYASICSITYCAFFGWIIYTSEVGFENFLSPFLNWKYWKIGANLSYAIYLVQFAVFHYNIGKTRGSTHFSFYGSIIDLNEMFIILLSAIALTVCVDYPFRNLKKAFSDRNSAKIERKSL